MRGAYQLWWHSLDARAAGKFLLAWPMATAISPAAAAAILSWGALKSHIRLRSRLAGMIHVHLHLLIMNNEYLLEVH